jgi:hypothetical protein
MKIRLIASGQELDMFDEVQLNVTYSIEDILDLSSRRSEYTREFNLPGTKKNKEFFNNIQEVNIDVKRSFLIAIPAQIFVGDKPIVTGSLRLIKSQNVNNNIVFQVQVTGRFRDLMTEIDKLVPNDLDFSELNHVRNLPTISNSWDNESGYVYPYIVSGHSNDIFDKAYIWDLFPALFVKTLTDKIFDKTGFTVKSKFMESDYFKSLIIPWNRDTLQDVNLDERICDIGVVGVDMNYFDGSIITNTTDYVPMTPVRERATSWWNSSAIANRIRLQDTTTIDFRDDLNSFETINVGFIPPPVGAFPAGQWKCKANGVYDINFVGYVFPQYFNIVGGPIIYNDSKLGFEYNYRLVHVKASGATIILDQTDGTQFFNPGTKTLQDFEIDLDTDIPNMQPWRLSAQNIFMEEGDVIQVRYGFRFPSLNFAGNNNNIRCRLVMKRDFGGEFSRLFIRPAENKTFGNEFVNMNTFLPENISITNLFLDILKMFNLVVAPDKLTPNQLIIEPREDWWKSRQRVKYWEWNLESPFDIKPMSEVNFNRFAFKYLEDSDYLNNRYRGETQKVFGNKLLKINNDYSDTEGSLQLSTFASTPLSNSFTNDRIAPYFVEKEDNNLRSRNVNFRILFYTGLKPCAPWQLRNTVSGGQTFTNYPYAGPYDDPLNPKWSLNFGPPEKIYHPQNQFTQNDLFNKFWRSTFNQLVDKNNRIVEAFFPLTSEDIADLDFRDIIVLDGGFHRINSIIDYNPDRLTKVQLYKINITDTYDLNAINIPRSNRACPTDIVTIREGGREYFSSNNGQITPDCCSTLGGQFEEGVCYLPENTGVIIDIGVTPVISLRPNADFVDRNSINKVGTKVSGFGNYVSKDSNALQVAGNDNSILKGTNTSQVFGDRIIADRANLFYVNDVAVDPDGDIINIKPYIINGGKNTTLPASRSNVVEILHGGVNAVRNSGGDIKKRVVISDNPIGIEFGERPIVPITNVDGTIEVIQTSRDTTIPFSTPTTTSFFVSAAVLNSALLLRWDFQVIGLTLQTIPTGNYYVVGDFTNIWEVRDSSNNTIFTYVGNETTCGTGQHVITDLISNIEYKTTFRFYLCGDIGPLGFPTF